MAAVSATMPVPAHELHIDPSKNELPKLRSNRGAYVNPSSIGWMKPTAHETPVEEVRKRFEQDGYVWIKHLIPREDVLDMRQHYFEMLQPTGILKPGSSPRDGIFDPSQDPLAHNGVGGENLPEGADQIRRLTEAHVTPIYQAFLEHPQLRAFIRQFMGWEKETMVIRNMLRHNTPHGLSTGVHYDRIFLRAGEAEFLTAWVPIGDCAANGGGLTYLADSTQLGRNMEKAFTEAAKDMTPEERINGFNKNMNKDGQLSHDIDSLGRGIMANPKWLVANYEAGDVVFHNPYMIHGAGKNEDDSGRIRLSSDVRFYEEGAHMDLRWMQPWRPDDGL